MNQEEKILRQSIRQLIRHVKQKKLNEETQFKNHIWYRICVKDSKILIVSFVFSYKLKTKKIGEIYYNKINELIKSSELN